MEPRYQEIENDFHLCRDCSFVNRKITEKEYLKYCGILFDGAHASIKDGEAVVWIGIRPPWDITPQDIRNSLEYVEWRNKVFDRDKYTCKKCGQVGGQLNAHHIKPFATHEDLRFELSNGMTLCVKCHREVHRKG